MYKMLRNLKTILTFPDLLGSRAPESADSLNPSQESLITIGE